MSVREGSLEAPTRHPLAWKDASFYDEAALSAELERVFDICHGCRRCVNLCNAFPTLFDLIDEGPSGEVDGVDKRDFRKVVDQCYLCDVCYMTKCPYVPPHEWNVDFPHLMLRAKAVRFRKGEARVRDKVLTSTDALGKLAAIPVLAQTVNAMNRNRAARKLLQGALGVHPDRELPPYSPRPFRRHAQPRGDFPVRDGERAPGKVAIFATCYVNFNEPGIGVDLLLVLAHNEIPAVLAPQESCCGMPKLELGDLESVERLMRKNIPELAGLARQGWALLAPIPSCALMFKQELPLMFPDDVEVKLVADRMYDPFEYLMLRYRDGLLKTDFKRELGTVSYHIPCHGRVQNLGQKTRETLQLVPGTKVNTVERCAGHDGTWGVKTEYFELSMKIGRPVFRQMAQGEPSYISSDCPIAGRHIQQGIRDSGVDLRAQKHHPLSLLRIAYGL